MTRSDHPSPAAGPGPAADDVVPRRPGDPEPWVVVEEKPGYDGFLTVKVRRYRLPDGREVDWDVFGPRLTAGVRAGITVLAADSRRPDRHRPDVPRRSRPGGDQPAGRADRPGRGARRGRTTGARGGDRLHLRVDRGRRLAMVRGFVGLPQVRRDRPRLPAGRSAVASTSTRTACRSNSPSTEFRTELRTPGAMTGIDAAYAGPRPRRPPLTRAAVIALCTRRGAP